MTKLLSFFIIFLVTINNCYTYTPSNKDLKTIDSFNNIIDDLYISNKQQVYDFGQKLDWLIPIIKYNPKIEYILSEVNDYIYKKLSSNDQNSKTYNVVKVIDWDTVKINYKWKSKNIRLIWIDAPENSTTRYWYTQANWEQSKQKLENLIWNNPIKLEFDDSQWKYDSFDRLLAYIFVDWININQKMIESWMAKEYTYDKPYKYQKQFIDAQNIAKQKSIWIWSDYQEKVSDYKYYTSSYYSARLYYCETDDWWKNLSKKYLKVFDTKEELLNEFPDRELSEECG